MPIPNKAISEMTELAARPADNDLLPVVDDSDTTDASSGTTKGILFANLLKSNVTVKVNVNYTATGEDDVILYDLSAGVARTLTLEAAANRSRPRCIKNLSSSTATLTIAADGSETIDGAATIELAPGDKVWLIPSDTDAWESI